MLRANRGALLAATKALPVLVVFGVLALDSSDPTMTKLFWLAAFVVAHSILVTLRPRRPNQLNRVAVLLVSVLVFIVSLYLGFSTDLSLPLKVVLSILVSWTIVVNLRSKERLFSVE